MHQAQHTQNSNAPTFTVSTPRQHQHQQRSPRLSPIPSSSSPAPPPKSDVSSPRLLSQTKQLQQQQQPQPQPSGPPPPLPSAPDSSSHPGPLTTGPPRDAPSPPSPPPPPPAPHATEYHIVETLSRGAHTVVHRALTSAGSSVILKCVASSPFVIALDRGDTLLAASGSAAAAAASASALNPDAARDADRLRREFHIGSKLGASEWVIKYLELARDPFDPALPMIVMEDVPGSVCLDVLLALMITVNSSESSSNVSVTPTNGSPVMHPQGDSAGPGSMSSSSLNSLAQSPSVSPYMNASSTGTTLAFNPALVGAKLPKKFTARGGKIDIETFLELAIELARGLASIHNAGVCHRDIKPSNILVVVNRQPNLNWRKRSNDTVATESTQPQQQGKVIRYLDFDLATSAKEEIRQVDNLVRLAGTLHYMSPEQTGRMDRKTDYRTDFYSLGVVFYQLLTGILPFAETGMSELVYCHIAVTPHSPCEVDISVPAVLSAIVMKMMEKDADKRYQSAEGIEEDLLNCQAMLQAKQPFTEFPLGQKDLSNKFSIPQKLYGRDQETALLVDAFEKTLLGQPSLVLVSGFSGIGKTALVNELQRPVFNKKGYFLTGKCDYFHKALLYGAFKQAFHSLVKHILATSEEEVNSWKIKIQSALGANAQVLVDLLPEIEMIIGKQKPLADVDPVLAQNRFNQAVSSFVGVIASADRPAVLFLDNLQWMDSGSLGLLKAILNGQNHMLIIGSYRSNEIDQEPFLKQTLEEIEKGGITVNKIFLQPLDLEAVNLLVSDTLHCAEQHSLPLSNFIFTKTEGNSYCVRLFLEFLYNNKLLKLTADSSRRRTWTWDIKQIQAKGVPAGMAELMTQRIHTLPAPVLRVLTFASCFGSQIPIRELALVLGISESTLLSDLEPAFVESVLTQVGSDQMQFPHDKVQERVYDCIPPEDKANHHLRIARTLLQKLPPSEVEHRLFEILKHFTIGVNRIEDDAERSSLAKLFLQATVQAKKMAAFKSALTFLETGCKCLTKNHWSTQYQLSYQLFSEFVEVSYLNSDFPACIQYADVLIANSATVLDKAAVYIPLTIQYTIQAQYEKAVNSTAAGLKLLGAGVELPDDINIDSETKIELQKATEWMKTHELSSIYTQAECTDQTMKLVLKLLATVLPTCFFGKPEMHSYCVTKAFNLTVIHGPTPDYVTRLGSFGIILGGMLGEYKKADECGELGMRFSKKYDDKIGFCKAGVISCMFHRHWVAPLSEELQLADLILKSCMELGELEYCNYAIGIIIHTNFVIGTSLAELIKNSMTLIKFCTEKNQPSGIFSIFCVLLAILRLCNNNLNKSILGNMNEERFLRECPTKTSICTYQILKGQTLYMFGEYSKAEHCLQSVEEMAPSIIPAWHALAVLNEFQSLSLLELYAISTPEEKQQYLKKVKENQKKMAVWANHCPQNFQHKLMLVNACLQGVLMEKPFGEILSLYDDAVQCAKSSGIIPEEALANELCAKFSISHKHVPMGRYYLEEAARLYNSWGASSKRMQLLEKYSSIMRNLPRHTTTENRSTEIVVGQESESIEVDIQAIINASQAIAQELDLPQLLRKIMQIVMTNAGAMKAAFLLQSAEGVLKVNSECKADKDIEVMKEIPLNEWPDGSASIVRYVSRTKKCLVLPNASEDKRFNQDQYVTKQTVKSVLCLPITNQSELIGVLYLENSLTVNAFPKSRIEILQIFASQIGICFKNLELLRIRGRQELFNRTFPAVVVKEMEERGLLSDPNQYTNYVPRATVMFADIVGFTSKCNKLGESDTPLRVLNSLFSGFDRLTREASVEKIKTVGDAYMVASGVPQPRTDHLQAVILLALQMNDYCHNISFAGEPLQMRFGLATGPIHCGIIGLDKLQFDLIGPTVNLASRLESSGRPLCIQLPDALRVELELDQEFMRALKARGAAFVGRTGAVVLKGFEPISTCFIGCADSIIEITPQESQVPQTSPSPDACQQLQPISNKPQPPPPQQQQQQQHQRIIISRTEPAPTPTPPTQPDKYSTLPTIQPQQGVTQITVSPSQPQHQSCVPQPLSAATITTAIIPPTPAPSPADLPPLVLQLQHFATPIRLSSHSKTASQPELWDSPSPPLGALLHPHDHRGGGSRLSAPHSSSQTRQHQPQSHYQHQHQNHFSSSSPHKPPKTLSPATITTTNTNATSSSNNNNTKGKEIDTSFITIVPLKPISTASPPTVMASHTSTTARVGHNLNRNRRHHYYHSPSPPPPAPLPAATKLGDWKTGITHEMGEVNFFQSHSNKKSTTLHTHTNVISPGSTAPSKSTVTRLPPITPPPWRW
ncbi:AAA family ATPase [Pelomyxa schiedti]|nr:AAA family ATPase [Pelomyxa schiedti]